MKNQWKHTEVLGRDLRAIAELLRKYKHCGQADVVEEILATLETSTPDYDRLRGIDVWGGSGAVWEVNLCPARKSGEEKLDHTTYLEAIVQLATAMEDAGLATARTRSIAATFQSWLDKGL